MKAVVRKEKVVLKTYPYSDPAPMPEFGRIYPYNRFDGYALHGSNEVWEMVVLENAFIKVWINPAVGGKVWGAIEKSTGKEFIYFNHTVKFRDVAMRGPWTSGGIEFNVGILGHSLSCSSPVDHHTRENADGSVSCFIGATDWPSRTRWIVEISLTEDAAWFRTSTSWYNISGEDQAYYNWSNAGIKTSGDLEYIFPGHVYLGHDGKAHPWPVDIQGRDLSRYERNDLGHYKSYHVFGSASDFWGCYWQKDHFGMAHYSLYDDKPGKKIWIWGLSRYGMIWEDLLTDADGQYTEVQSGRLFNQSISSSSNTPFKHRSFLPGSFDIWDEYWMPVKGMGGLDYSCPALSFHIGADELHICANQLLNHVLRVEDEHGVLASVGLKMKAMEEIVVSLAPWWDGKRLRLWLDDLLVYDAREEQYQLKRPTEIAAGYRYDSVEGLYLQGKEWARQRFFTRAMDKYTACLENDPYYIRALVGMAALKLRSMDYEESLGYLTKALSIDSYDGEANYLYGVVRLRMGDMYDAKDGFSIASQSLAYRAAAMTELGRMLVLQKQYGQALRYLEAAVASNAGNIQAIHLRVFALRKMGKVADAQKLGEERLGSDPLDHLLRYEIMPAEVFTDGITSEWPHETFLEVASFYYGIDAWDEAMEVLALAPAHPMIGLWKAYLAWKLGLDEDSLEEALTMSAMEVFPHRWEDMNVLEWAMNRTRGWQVKFFFALGLIQHSKEDLALELLEACGNVPSYYPFYLVRAGLNKTERDLLIAIGLAPDAWRPYQQLCKLYIEGQQWEKALQIAQRGYTLHPGNYYLGLQLARCYMFNEQYDEGIGLMSGLRVLPNEGASEGRNVWRETNLYAAIAALAEGRYDLATGYIGAARTWPENIGVGKPYDVDERLEDYLDHYRCRKEGDASADVFKERILSFRVKYPEWPTGSGELFAWFFAPGGGWSYEENDGLPMRWCRAFVAGDRLELERLSGEKPAPQVALPYEIPFEDRDFMLIRKMYQKGLLTTKN